jgi:hypothetical protein
MPIRIGLSSMPVLAYSLILELTQALNQVVKSMNQVPGGPEGGPYR